ETGTGKELIAKAIHAKSPRAKAPFVAINCGSLPETLLESELFGHQKGSFTGATSTRKGFLEVVSGGSLFLDEIGEISPKMQVDLLRVLEDKKVIRIGDRQPIDVDFRLISATRKDLAKEVGRGSFREDFFYRINVITIHVPPLRERKEDIPLLVRHFLEKYSHQTAKQVDRITPDAMAVLTNYDWPGNVRELENGIERAVVLSKSRTLHASNFSFIGTPPSTYEPRSLREMQSEYVREVLEKCDWNITRASRILDINRVTLHRMIKRFNLRGIQRAKQ
ncbi:MAG: sigma-54-dependent Fis family transcriptional regulator, partial [Deltaproteobacteria bacterium]|nr:sigma-54-dependent Fis family transcriptional regulator [Deltaproteobacteria bacterium]